MIKPLLQTLVLATIIVATSSCSTTMYTTNAVNVPLLKEKGELKVNMTQNDLQAAVAVSDNIGVIVNGFYKSYTADNDYKHFGGLGELGIGYLVNRDNLVVETYIGGGVGKIHKQEQFTNPTNNTYMANFDANAAKGFIQSNLGFRSKYFDVALTPKFSFVKYTNFTHSNYSDVQLKDSYLDNNRLTNSLYVFAEPAVTVRAGFKFIKLQAQYGLTVNLGGQSIKHSPDFATLGLVVDIAKWYND